MLLPDVLLPVVLLPPALLPAPVVPRPPAADAPEPVAPVELDPVPVEPIDVESRRPRTSILCPTCCARFTFEPDGTSMYEAPEALLVPLWPEDELLWPDAVDDVDDPLRAVDDPAPLVTSAFDSMYMPPDAPLLPELPDELLAPLLAPLLAAGLPLELGLEPLALDVEDIPPDIRHPVAVISLPRLVVEDWPEPWPDVVVDCPPPGELLVGGV